MLRIPHPSTRSIASIADAAATLLLLLPDSCDGWLLLRCWCCRHQLLSCCHLGPTNARELIGVRVWDDLHGQHRFDTS
jgi:hypothetical protein